MTAAGAREVFLDTSVTLHNFDITVTELPLATPFNLPFGAIGTRPSVWLQVEGAVEGVQGAYGAAEGTSLPAPIPMYDDYSGNLEPNVRGLADDLRGTTRTLQEVQEALADAQLDGYFGTARMTVEAALLDMAARSQNISVYEALTGERPDEPILVPYGKSIAENDRFTLVTAGIAAMGKGASRLKFKLSPSNHEAVITGIRQLQLLYPDASFMVDANGMFDPDNPEHRKILNTVDDLDLMMIEEPVSRAKGAARQGLDAHRRLQEVLPLRTPIALDDAVTSTAAARTALVEGLGEIINLKPGRVGSFIECLEIADLAKANGRQIMVGGMLEATPGRSMTLTLAALCLREGFTIPGDVSLPQERITQDLVPASEQLHLNDHGEIVFLPRAGWGYTL